MKKLIVLVISMALFACSNKEAKSDIEYGTTKTKNDGGLQVPPTLTSPDFTPALKNANYKGQVLPEIEGFAFEKSGRIRYLVVDDTAENIWDRLLSFSASQNLALSSANPETGVMRTDWMENQAKTKNYLLGGLFNKEHQSTERDRFTFWIERQGSAQTRLYVAHEGQTEYVHTDSKIGRDAVARLYWTPRPSEPAFEVEMLRRVMVFTGASEEESTVAAKEALVMSEPVIVAKQDEKGDIRFDGSADKAWEILNHDFLSAGYTIVSRSKADRSIVLLFDRADYEEPSSLERLLLRKKAVRRDQIVQVDAVPAEGYVEVVISSPEIDSPLDEKTRVLFVETILDALNEGSS